MGRRKNPKRPQSTGVASANAKEAPQSKNRRKRLKRQPGVPCCWIESIGQSVSESLVVEVDHNHDETDATIDGSIVASTAAPPRDLTIWITRALLQDTLAASSAAPPADDEQAETTMTTATTSISDQKQPSISQETGVKEQEARSQALPESEAVKEQPMQHQHPASTLDEDNDDTNASATAVGSNDHPDNPPEPSLNSTNRLIIRRHPLYSPPPPPAPRHYTKQLKHGDNGDGIVNPHPGRIPNKFWAQRHRLFSRFNQGIRLDDHEAWFSVTPEAIANHVAKKLLCNGRILPSAAASQTEAEASSPPPSQERPLVVLDAFCGWGGNAIALARRRSNVVVIAVDCERSRLEQLAHNAAIYEIPSDQLLLVHADAIDVLEQYQNGRLVEKQAADGAAAEAAASPSTADSAHGYRVGGLELLPNDIGIVFLSPPWGGPSYQQSTSDGLGNTVNAFPLERIQIRRQQTRQAETSHEESTSDSIGCSNPIVDGVALLSMALRAVPEQAASSAEAAPTQSNDATASEPLPVYQVAYFLPRNIDGCSVGQAAHKAGYKGLSIELEQQYLQHKFKTVTAYF